MQRANLLEQNIQFLKGVGPQRAKLLADELDVHTLRDLLYTFPFKYIDRSVVHTIASLQEDLPLVQLRGHILDFEKVEEGPHKRIKAFFSDGTGVVELVWFKALKYVENSYKIGHTYVVLGKPTLFGRRFSIAHPEVETLEEAAKRQGGFQPHYSIPEKLKKHNFSSRTLSQLIASAFQVVGDDIGETLPEIICSRHGLMPLSTALRIVHYPPKATDLPAARRRLKFEELFYLQLEILRYRRNRKASTGGFTFKHVGDCFNQFYHEYLPFNLTGAQQRVIKEIWRDMRSGKQMNRLLQGDVGSGKTMVALMCCLLAIDNGFQACLMAPTEILAEQHLATLRAYLGSMPVRVELLTGNVRGRERRRILEGVASGEVHILVGTHALIEPTVGFLNLGLAIIDEQHRFGVKQRAKLWAKNMRPPHVLVMTATPIPRTLAMTVYGDLDVSVIDELPPGRKPIKTVHYFNEHEGNLVGGLRRELQQGRQIYVVYPLIEESEKSDLKDLEQGYQELCRVFPDFKVGKVHGRMASEEKEEAMRSFLARETQILVSTTVIEVGVNVPNASVMVIEEANRFGLAQLHQLRGRVGRGADQSYCILVTRHQLSEDTRKRMEIMVESTDGFVIAEEDLKLRGPGDLDGTAQSGLPFNLRIAHIVKDNELMVEARQAAERLIEADPEEKLPQFETAWRVLRSLKREKQNFSDIS